MNAAPSRTSQDPPCPPAARRRAAAVLVAALWLGTAVTSRAQAPRLPVAPDALEILDVKPYLKARSVLKDDELLRPFDLEVRVAQGIATVRGQVSSETVAKHALKRLAEIPGVVGVRNELKVIRPAEATPSSPPPWANAGPPARPADTLTGRGGAEIGLGHSSPLRDGDAGAGAGVTLAVTLLAPEPIVARGEPAARAAGQADPLARQVEQMRQRDERLGRVQVEVRGGAVVIRGAVRRPEDVDEFTRAVARLPGVTQVVLEHVKADGGRGAGGRHRAPALRID